MLIKKKIKICQRIYKNSCIIIVILHVGLWDSWDVSILDWKWVFLVSCGSPRWSRANIYPGRFLLLLRQEVTKFYHSWHLYVQFWSLYIYWFNDNFFSLAVSCKVNFWWGCLFRTLDRIKFKGIREGNYLPIWLACVLNLVLSLIS